MRFLVDVLQRVATPPAAQVRYSRRGSGKQVRRQPDTPRRQFAP